jgi:DNA-binding transcriptional MerR regulator
MSNLAFQDQRPGRAFDESQINSKAVPTPPQGDGKAPRKAQGAFRTISEVADELDVPQHVLRFWETKFTQVKPLKRGGGRRYYRPEDVALLKHIYYLLYTEGYTIKGAQKLLKGQGRNQIAAQVAASEEKEAVLMEQPKATHANEAVAVAEASTPGVPKLNESQRSALQGILEELKALRSMLPESESSAA